jgi:hypothetical protein
MAIANLVQQGYSTKNETSTNISAWKKVSARISNDASGEECPMCASTVTQAVSVVTISGVKPGSNA